jgi:hypothetical protein
MIKFLLNSIELKSQIENVWHLEIDDEKYGALQCPTLSADE